MRAIWRLLAAVFIFMAASYPAAATDVVPSSRVVRWVNIRTAPDSASPAIGRLAPGEQVELIEVVPAWYVVRLPDGRQGYVSRAWTRLVDEASAQPAYFVHLIDVGTGLAVFVEGQGFTLLYDAGSNDDIARGEGNRVVAYLSKVRPTLSKIDHVVLSHPHKDHVELMPDVLRAYEVGDVWDSGRTNAICSYRAFLRLIRDRGIRYHDAHPSGGEHVVPLDPKTCYGAAESAETIRFPHASPIALKERLPLGPGASMTFLHATAAPMASVNENSLVAVLDLGRSRVLLTGDAEAGGRNPPSMKPHPKSVEGEVLECCAADLRADILVVGHHGSKTSSRTDLLDRVGAYIFLVSAGPTRYQSVTLPDVEVIDELATRGTVYRTDRNDPACRIAAAKIGPDNDNRAGGCENILVSINPDGAIQVEEYRLGD